MLLKHETEFGTTQDALLKTLVMMSGELEYPKIFFDYGKVPFPGVTYTIFVIFFLLISIVTLNLLVGLTVDDIKASLDQAEIRNLTLKVIIYKTLSRDLSRFFNFTVSISTNNKVHWADFQTFLGKKSSNNKVYWADS